MPTKKRKPRITAGKEALRKTRKPAKPRAPKKGKTDIEPLTDDHTRAMRDGWLAELSEHVLADLRAIQQPRIPKKGNAVEDTVRFEYKNTDGRAKTVEAGGRGVTQPSDLSPSEAVHYALQTHHACTLCLGGGLSINAEGEDIPCPNLFKLNTGGFARPMGVPCASDGMMAADGLGNDATTITIDTKNARRFMNLASDDYVVIANAKPVPAWRIHTASLLARLARFVARTGTTLGSALDRLAVKVQGG